MPEHRYRAYGLLVASEIELPELAAAPAETDGAEPDLHIRLGRAPERIEAPTDERVTWTSRPGEWLHDLDGVARYYVRDGREVTVEPTGGAPADVRAFLFASTLGAVLHHRQMFVLHAAALAHDGQAVAVAGPSGVGKSTTLVELARRGYSLLSDDKTVVRFDDGGPTVLSGFPAVRLWRDAVERIGEAPESLPAVREGIGKHVYHPPGFRTEAAPLRALVVLQRVSEARPELDRVEAERLSGHVALGASLRQTYRRRIVDGSGFKAEHFRWAARLASAVPVVRVARPRHGQTVAAVADAVEQALADAVAEG